MPVFVNALIRFTASETPDASIETFTGWATTMLSWFITTMGTILNFFLSHPIVLVGLVMSLIVAAIGMLRHIIGGKAKVESEDKEKLEE